MKKLDNYSLLNQETLLSTSNGYVGMRANFEEGYKNGYTSITGTYINGFYDTSEIYYDEICYGFPRSAQKMVNVHNAQGIYIYIDGDIFNVFDGNVIEINRELDIKNGYAIRKIRWQSPKGHDLEFTFKRMASFAKLELLTIDVKIKSINYTGDIQIISKIDFTVDSFLNVDDPRAGNDSEAMLQLRSVKSRDNTHMLISDTINSNLCVATCCSYNVPMDFKHGETSTNAKCILHINADESVHFIKYITYTDSIHHKNIENTAIQIAKQSALEGINFYYDEQKKYLDKFWQYAYIEVNDDKNVEYALNYNLYQLLSSAGKDKYSSIGAKGLSGGGYDGHYFWDTEIYMIPFFTLTMPEVARNLLKFRYQVLNAAKDRSKEMGHKTGAKIPWRTISGSECSSYYAAGSAQYHINADIAYAIIQYYLFTKDIDMLKEFGYEVIYETARIWLEVGNYNLKGQYCINTVTGPDEYTAIVNNNYYTNSLAKYHLEWAVKLGDVLKDDDRKAFNSLCQKLVIVKDEINEMQKAAQNMLLPFDDKLNIHMQDDSFLNKKEWDFENTPKDKYPLLLHYHPLHIYRHKVLKQADTILSYVLLDNVREDVMKDSYYYYKQRTTHDSSLSPCVHSMMASRIRSTHEAYDYFMSTIRLDLDDINRNTKDGLHIANAGGAYMAMVYGFAGLRIKEDGIYLRPVKPNEWNSYSFKINYQGQLVKITVDKAITIHCEKQIEITIYDKRYVVKKKLHINLV